MLILYAVFTAGGNAMQERINHLFSPLIAR
jgi:hypothetical protein